MHLHSSLMREFELMQPLSHVALLQIHLIKRNPKSAVVSWWFCGTSPPHYILYINYHEFMHDYIHQKALIYSYRTS